MKHFRSIKKEFEPIHRDLLEMKNLLQEINVKLDKMPNKITIGFTVNMVFILVFFKYII